MPCYEYSCDNCGHCLEVYQKLDEKPLKKCPLCKKNKLFKLISLTARPVVAADPRDEYKQIKREAKEYAKRIIKGDQEAIADIYGEDVATGKLKKAPPVPTQKIANNKKKGIIKRR